jgi:hypothetical protein
VSKDNNYEFQLVSRREQIKILIAKTIVFLAIISFLYLLLDQSTQTESYRYRLAGWVLVGIFAYMNLMNIQSRLMEVFEFTFDHKGLEFVLPGSALIMYGHYLLLFGSS